MDHCSVLNIDFAVAVYVAELLLPLGRGFKFRNKTLESGCVIYVDLAVHGNVAEHDLALLVYRAVGGIPRGGNYFGLQPSNRKAKYSLPCFSGIEPL